VLSGVRILTFENVLSKITVLGTSHS